MQLMLPWFGLFGLMWLIVPVLVAGLIVWAVRSQPAPLPPPPPSPSRETPLEILARRFASGEISPDEYQKARDLLQGGGPPPS